MPSKKSHTRSHRRGSSSSTISVTAPAMDANEKVTSWIGSQSSMDGSIEAIETWRQENPEMTLPSPAPTLKKRVAFTSSTGDNEGKTARKYGNKLKRQAENQNMISPTVSPSKLPFAPDPPRSRGLRDQSKIRQTPTSNVAISMQRFSAESAIMAPVLRPQSAVRVKRQQVGTPRPDLIRWVNTSAVQMAPPRVPHQKNSNYVISQPALWSAYPYPAVMPPTPRPVPLPTPELKDLDFVDFCACTYCDGGWESKLESQMAAAQRHIHATKHKSQSATEDVHY